MHPAEEYLRNEQNPPVLYVRIYGERRKLFINRGGENVIGIIAKGKRKHGYIFSDWNSIEKIYYPSQEKEDEKDMDRKMILKYQKLARLATHTNDWLRKIAAADLEKSLYENRITTGTAIDGKCIRLSTIEKYCGSWVIENRAVQFSFISLPENVCSVLAHISWLRYFLKSRPYLLVVMFQLCSLAMCHSIKGIKYSVRITVSDINFA